jgi:hypothetical protein
MPMHQNEDWTPLAPGASKKYWMPTVRDQTSAMISITFADWRGRQVACHSDMMAFPPKD